MPLVSMLLFSFYLDALLKNSDLESSKSKMQNPALHSFLLMLKWSSLNNFPVFAKSIRYVSR